MSQAVAAAPSGWLPDRKKLLRTGALFALTSFYLLSQAADVYVFHLGVDIYLARLAMLAMAGGLALLIRGRVLECLRPLRGLLIIASIWTIYLLINAVFGLNLRTSLELLLRFSGTWIIAFEIAVLLRVSDRNALAAMGWALLVGMVVLALIRVLDAAGVAWLDWLRGRIRNARPRSARAQGLYVNPNILGMVTVFHAAVLIWYTLHRRRSLLIIPCTWLTALWVVLQSESRSALIGWIGLCLLSSLAYWKAFLTQAGKPTRTAIFLSALVLMLVLIAITLYSSPRFSTLAAAVFRMDRPQTAWPDFRLDPASIDPARVYIWQTAVRIWTEQPWLGIGLGAFKHLPEVGRFTHAHNFLLTVLVEQGLIGLGFLIALAVLLIRRMRSWVGTSLLACVLCSQLFDDLTPIVAFPIYMALILGYCLFLALPHGAETGEALPFP